MIKNSGQNVKMCFFSPSPLRLPYSSPPPSFTFFLSCQTFLFPCSLLLPFAIVEKTASNDSDFISVWLLATVHGIGFDGACAPWACDTSCWRICCHTPRPDMRMGKVSGMLCFISSIVYLELGDDGEYSPVNSTIQQLPVVW